jgi:hypothetical protein
MTTKTTTARSLPSCAPARLNPNRSEFTYRYVRTHAAEEALRLGYLPHPECFIGSPYEMDSILMEWLCECPDPLEKNDTERHTSRAESNARPSAPQTQSDPISASSRLTGVSTITN